MRMVDMAAGYFQDTGQQYYCLLIKVFYE